MGYDSDQYYKGCVRLLQEILGILSGAKSFWGLRGPDVEKLLNFLDILQILGMVEEGTTRKSRIHGLMIEQESGVLDRTAC